MNLSPARYDLVACNLVLASIAALLMAAVGSSAHKRRTSPVSTSTLVRALLLIPDSRLRL